MDKIRIVANNPGHALDHHDLRTLDSLCTPTSAPCDYKQAARDLMNALADWHYSDNNTARKIDAIKAFRVLTGDGLKESKDAVEYAIGQRRRGFDD